MQAAVAVDEANPAMPERRIRVWLLGLPPLLADMALSSLGEDAAFELVVHDDRRLRARPVLADALLTARRLAAVERLLLAAPRMQAFVISRDAGSVRWVRMCPRHEPLGELSFAELGQAIKKAVQPPPRPPRGQRGREHGREQG
jgi:hypothetical protein